jgi:hypothetical protein
MAPLWFQKAKAASRRPAAVLPLGSSQVKAENLTAKRPASASGFAPAPKKKCRAKGEEKPSALDLSSLLDDRGLVPEKHMADAVRSMKQIEADDTVSQLALVCLLESSVQSNMHAAAAFQRTGGVTALKPWMQAALPVDGVLATACDIEAQQRRENVMHASVLLLRHIPVAVRDLHETRLGFLLRDLRGSCVVGREDIQALIKQWKESCRKQTTAPVAVDEKMEGKLPKQMTAPVAVDEKPSLYAFAGA